MSSAQEPFKPKRIYPILNVAPHSRARVSVFVYECECVFYPCHFGSVCVQVEAYCYGTNRTTYICVSIHKNSYLYLCLSFALCVIQFVWLVSVLYLQRCCCCCFSLFLLFSMFYLHTPFFSLVFFKMCTNGCVENVRKYSMDIICDGKCRRRRRQKKKNVVGLIYRLCCSWHVSHYIISGQ